MLDRRRLGPIPVARSLPSGASWQMRATSMLIPGMVAALAGAVLLWTRLLELDVSFWHDEVFTVVQYSSRGPDAIFFGESEPNNHVLYSLLSWATTRVLGESEETYRLWSAVPGISAVAGLGWWSSRRLGVPTAAAFVILAVTSRVHLDLSTQARGYGLAFLAAALMLIAADRVSLTGTKRAVAAFAGAGLLGICTLYVFALAFAGQTLVLLAKRAVRRRVVAASTAVGFAALAFYSPLLDDIADRQPRGQVLALYEVVTQPLKDLAVPNVQLLFSTDSLLPFYVAIAAVLAGIGGITVWRRAGHFLALALVVPPLFTYLTLAVAGIAVQARYGSYLLFHVLLLIATGVAELGGGLARVRALRPVTIVAGLLLAFFACARILDESARRQDLPLENFKDVAEVVDGTGIQAVVTDSSRPAGLRYYIGDDRLRVLRRTHVERLLCNSSGPLVYIRQPLIPPYVPPADPSCLVSRGATRVRIEQRGYGDLIDVWVITRPEAGEGRVGPSANEALDGPRGGA
jgi:hypothetical protein